MKNIDIRSLVTLAFLVLACLIPTLAFADGGTPAFEEAVSSGAEPGTVRVFPCELGEELLLTANAIKRVSVDRAEIISVDAVDDGRVLRFRCSAEGSATVGIDYEGRSRFVLISVALPSTAEVANPRECGDLSGVEARVIIEKNASRFVAVFGASDAQESCVRAHLADVTWSSKRRTIASIAW